MNKYSRLGKNSLYILIGNIGAKLIGFIMLPFYTQWLSVEDYGITDMAQVYQNFLLPLLTLGLGEAIFLFPMGAKTSKRQEYFSTTCLAVLVCEVLFFGAYSLLPSQLTNLVVSASLSQYSFYIAAYIFCSSFQQIVQQFARGIDQMKVFSYTGIVNTLTVALFSVVLIPAYQLEGFFAAMILGSIITVCYTFIALKAYRYFRLSIDKVSLYEMLRYALPLLPNATMWWVVNSINRPIMDHYVGLEGIGLYAVANKFPSIINTVFFIFFGAWQISAIEEFGKEGYARFYNKIFRMVFFILIFLCFVLTGFGKYILSALVSQQYIEAAPYIPLLCLGVLFANLSAFVGTTFTAIRQTRFFFYSSFLATCVAVGANNLLIPRIGVYGACIAILASQISMFLYRWVVARKYVTIQHPEKLVGMFLLLACSISMNFFIGNDHSLFWLSLLPFAIFLMANADIMKEVTQVLILKFYDRKH